MHRIRDNLYESAEIDQNYLLVINERFAAFHGITLALVLTGIWIAQRTAPKIDAEIQL